MFILFTPNLFKNIEQKHLLWILYFIFIVECQTDFIGFRWHNQPTKFGAQWMVHVAWKIMSSYKTKRNPNVNISLSVYVRKWKPTKVNEITVRPIPKVSNISTHKNKMWNYSPTNHKSVSNISKDQNKNKLNRSSTNPKSASTTSKDQNDNKWKHIVTNHKSESNISENQNDNKNETTVRTSPKSASNISKNQNEEKWNHSTTNPKSESNISKDQCQCYCNKVLLRNHKGNNTVREKVS